MVSTICTQTLFKTLIKLTPTTRFLKPSATVRTIVTSYHSETTDNTEENYRRRAQVENNPYGDLLSPHQVRRPVTRRERYLEAIRNIPQPRIGGGKDSKNFLEIKRRTENRNSVFYGSQPIAGGGIGSFTELGISKELCYQLADVGVRKPTQIQCDIIPLLKEDNNCIFIGPTGSGKTYCYLLPTIHRLLQANKEGYITRTRSPRIVIMVPTKELSVQVGLIVRHLTQDLDVTSYSLNMSGPTGRKKNLSTKPIDILIGTYTKIKSLYQSGDLNMEDLQHLVIDEIDKFLDYRDIAENKVFLQEMVAAEDTDTRCQIIMAGSLLSQTEFRTISSIFPNMYQYLHPRSHLPLAHLKQEFWFVNNIKKPEHFLAMLKYHLNSKENTTLRPLIFCNFTNTAYWLHKFLIDNDVNNICVTKDMDAKRRISLLRSGITSTSYPVVTTDMFSCGLDFRTFGLVVNYEFPFTYGDYLHRIGRTGRVSTNTDRCKAVSYVSHKRDKALFGTIRDSSLGNSCQSHVLVKPGRNTGWIKKQEAY